MLREIDQLLVKIEFSEGEVIYSSFSRENMYKRLMIFEIWFNCHLIARMSTVFATIRMPSYLNGGIRPVHFSSFSSVVRHEPWLFPDPIELFFRDAIHICLFGAVFYINKNATVT